MPPTRSWPPSTSIGWSPPGAARLWIEAGFLPAMSAGSQSIDPASLLGQVLAVWQRVNGADALGHYLDWATPTMYDTITAAIQELLGGRLTPEEFLGRLDADYQAYLASR